MNLRLLTILLLLTFTECQPTEQEEKHLSSAIYHWKSSYNPSKNSLEKLDQLHICKQYIRFFDIDLDETTGKAIPKSVIRFKVKPAGEVVPVVYITNRTMSKLTDSELPELAGNTTLKIKDLAKQNKLTINTLQIDCDWSKSTREAYFNFLKHLRKEFPDTQISATLRLHQIKFMEQTGVPPVDKATLMLYNVGDWTNPNTHNSLFDPEIIDQYVYRIPEYPLPIDLALPIFQQTLVYRNHKLFTFLKNKSPEDLSKNLKLKKTEDRQIFICAENGTLQHLDFRKGDIFRFEEVNFNELLQVKKAVVSRIKNKHPEILFYHLDESAMDKFSMKQLRQLLR